MDGQTDGWTNGWMDKWMDVKAVLRIAYTNQKYVLNVMGGLLN